MNKSAIALCALIASSLVACTPPEDWPQPTTPVVQATVPAKTGTIRTSAASTGLDDIPLRIALDTLREEGYVVETTEYARWDLVTSELASGALDIAPSSHQTAWAAIAQGAAIRAVIDSRRNPYLIACKAEITTCDDLLGKSIAYSTTSNVLAALANGYFRRNCPGAEPPITLIPSSSNRMAALLSGEIDAALLDEEDALQLDREAPGKFHVLRYLAEEFPQVVTGAFYVHSDFAASHPDIVKDFVKALLQANRRVQDPQVLRAAIERYLSGDANAQANAEAYLAHKAWEVNGGLDMERIEYTLTFLTDAGVVPSGLQADQLADASYLSAVLDEIGRQ